MSALIFTPVYMEAWIDFDSCIKIDIAAEAFGENKGTQAAF